VLIVRSQADRLTSADATPESTTGPANEEPTDEPTVEATTPPAPTVKVVEPKTLGGRKKLTNATLQRAAGLMKQGMADYPSATGSVSATYGQLGTRNVVLMAAATARVALPDATVSGMLSSFGSSNITVTGLTDVSTGSLGGTARCGNSTVAAQKAAICSWADHGSLGLIVFYFKSVTAIKAEFPKLRAQIEKKV
jgi:hypothetical protein